MFNSGYAELDREQAKHTIRLFEGDQPVVVPSGSCAAMRKDLEILQDPRPLPLDAAGNLPDSV